MQYSQFNLQENKVQSLCVDFFSDKGSTDVLILNLQLNQRTTNVQVALKQEITAFNGGKQLYV